MLLRFVMEISTNSLHCHWLLQVYMTSNNETVSRHGQNLRAHWTLQNSMTSGGNMLHCFTLGNIETLGKLIQWMNALLKQSNE